MTLLTIKEAAESTGHSTHKIRRLIKAIADDPTHADRSDIEPSPIDVGRLTAEGVQFTWRISEELVRRQLGDAPSVIPAGQSKGAESADLLDLFHRAMTAKEQAEAKLFDQLKTKDEQIAGLQQTVTSLNERLRESNMLMASLRQLPQGKRIPARSSTPDRSRPSSTAKKPAPKTPPPPAKQRRRSWLRTLFS